MRSEAKIFISYSRRNKDFTKRLFDALVQHGYDPWVDFDDIPFSVDWWEEIKDAIDQHDVIINIVSSASLISRVCNEEIKYARERNKRIIPLIVEDIDIRHVVGELYDQPYEMEARENWKYVRTLNWIYFFRESDNFEAGVNNIVSALETDHAHMRAHTRLLNRALEWERYNKGRGFLLRSEELLEAETWLAESANKKPEVLPLHRAYIEVSRTTQEEEERKLQQMQRQTRLLRRAAFGLIVTAGLAIGLIGVVLFNTIQFTDDLENTNEAIQQTNAAISEQSQRALNDQATEIANLDIVSEQATSLRLAIEAQSESERGNPSQLAIPLALAAYDVVENGVPPLRVQRIVSELVYSPGLVRFFVADNIPVNGSCAAPAEQTKEHPTGFAHLNEISEIVIASDTQVISGGQDGCVYIWDHQNGHLDASITSPGGRVTAIDINPAGDTIVVGDSNGRLTLWTLSGEFISEFEEGHTRRVTGVAYSASGDYILSGSLDALAILWDVETGEKVATLRGNGERLSTLTAHPTDLTFITGDTNGALVLWRLDRDGDGTFDNSVPLNLLNGQHTSAITSIGYSPDGENLLTIDLNKNVYYWRDGGRGDVNLLLDPAYEVVAANFLPQQYAVFSDQYGGIYYWDLTEGTSGEKSYQFVNIGDGFVNHMVSDTVGEYAFIGIDNGVLVQAELRDGSINQQFSLHRFPVENTWVRSDGVVVSREFNQDIVIWQPGTEQVQRVTQSALGATDGVLAANGDVLIGYNRDGILAQFNLTTGDMTAYPTTNGFVNGLDGLRLDTNGTIFSRDGKLALSVVLESSSNTSFSQSAVQQENPRVLWNIETGEILNDGQPIDILALINGQSYHYPALNYDGTRLATVGQSGAVISIVDLTTLEELARYELSRTVTALAWGDTENVLIAGYADGNVGFLDNIGSQWVDRRGDNFAVTDIDALMVNGKLFAATSSDGRTIFVWDVAGGEAIRIFTPRTRGTNLVRFGADGTTLITQSRASIAIVWRLDDISELSAWVNNNRFAPPLSASDCDSYQIPKPCGEKAASAAKTDSEIELPTTNTTPTAMPTEDSAE